MFIRTVAFTAILCLSAQADFSYDQNTRVTGGAMAGMMRVAGVFSKSAREPMRTTVLVKGDRMAMVSQDRINIIDLSAETMTDVDLAKKTYAVITFADMAKAMERMAQKMGQKQPEADVQFKANVKQTGQSRVISGLNTNETILTLEMEGSDKSGNKGAMQFTMDMWMAPSIPGYDEVRDFYARMAKKLPLNPVSSGIANQMMAQHGKGMSELVKEMSKLDGMPVLQITRIGGTAQGMPTEAEMQAAQQQQEQQQQPAPNASDAASDAAAGAALGRAGRIASGLGGFGGFGRRKKKAEPEQQAPAPPPQANANANASGSSSASLMELTTELSGFSSTPVDSAKLQVPAGFKQVSHDMEKLLK